MPSQTSTILLLALAGAALSKPTPSDFKLELATRDFSAIQQNFQPGKCAGTMLLYGRGTAEGGNMGLLVGPVFAEAIAAKGVDLAVQGINYPADVPGYLAGGDKGGSQLMAKLTQDTLKACPDSKVVMSGYSQGGQLVHNAAKSLPADVMGKVAGAVIFGDPYFPQAVQGVDKSKTLVICNNGDQICQQKPVILPQHLDYGLDAEKAAAFVAKL